MIRVYVAVTRNSSSVVVGLREGSKAFFFTAKAAKLRQVQVKRKPSRS